MTPGRRSVQRGDQAGTCQYCGAKLMRGYYFCLRCATPYKDYRSVAPDPGPPVLTEADLVKRKAPHVWPLLWTYLSVEFFGKDDKFLGFDIQRIAPLRQAESAEIVVPIPRDPRPARIAITY